jgi:hypothetical protein
VCHTLARGCEKKNGYMLPQKIMISICDSWLFVVGKTFGIFKNYLYVWIGGVGVSKHHHKWVLFLNFFSNIYFGVIHPNQIVPNTKCDASFRTSWNYGMKGNLMNLYLDEGLMKRGETSECKRDKRKDNWWWSSS